MDLLMTLALTFSVSFTVTVFSCILFFRLYFSKKISHLMNRFPDQVDILNGLFDELDKKRAHYEKWETDMLAQLKRRENELYKIEADLITRWGDAWREIKKEMESLKD